MNSDPEEHHGGDQQSGTPGDRREHILPRFSLKRRITVLMLLATTAVIGTIASLGIPLELIPTGYDEPSLSVRANWQDTPAEELLEKVTLPLEEELSTVPGLQDVYSWATTGRTSCFLVFKLGTDMDVAYREVRDRVERARARVPAEVDRITIGKQDATAIPVYMMSVAFGEEVTDSYNLIQNEIILPLKRIDGVADVNTEGLQEKEILIELDRELVDAAGLNIYELGLELGSDNFTMASGHVLSGERKLMLRSVAKYGSVEELENRMVAPNVRLGDIGTVRYEVPEKKFRVRAMGKEALVVQVLKEGEANALEISDKVDAVVEEMKKNPRLALVDVEKFFSQGSTIRESLGIMLDSGRIGGIFAALVLFFFLRRFRMTLIITGSIPLSLLIGLVAMYFFGESLNILTLLGLMISVGLLVDNSVVVAENIFRLHKGGMSRSQAVIHGAGEISLAILMATLTTIIVFLPVSLVEGQAQFFMMRLALPITVSLAASLIVALVFVPLAVYLTLPSHGAEEKTSRRGLMMRNALHRVYDATFERLNHGYNKVLAYFLRSRVDLIMAIILCSVGTGLLFEHVRKLEVSAVQEEDRSGFEIGVSMPQATTLEDAEKYFLEIEAKLTEMQEDLDLEGFFYWHHSTYGEINGWFKNPRTNDTSPRDAIQAFVAEMPEKGGVKVYSGNESENEKDSQNVQVYSLRGDDAAQLEDIADNLETVFQRVPGVVGIKRSGDVPTEELGLAVDRDRAQRLGISPEVVAGVVRNSLGGRQLPKFYRDGREIPVRVRYQEEDRESLAKLYDFQVPTNSGEAVALSAVASPERLEASKRIWRRNKQTARTITVELSDDDPSGTRRRLKNVIASLDLPEGVSFGNPRRGGGVDEDVAAMLFAIQLSIIFIYLLMGFLFESFVLPLSILATIPLAGFGVVWAHLITGYNLDPLGLVGVVILIGVVVNNGIVLVDYINRLRESGEERFEAVLLAADRRFRPIMMTALTTISGMVPLTLAGTTSIGMSYKSFGLTLIGGMTTATFLTLLVVPVFYTLFDDLRGAIGALFSGAKKLEEPLPKEAVTSAATPE